MRQKSQTKVQEEVRLSYSSIALLGDIWKLIRPYRARFLIATFLRLTSDLVWLYPAYALAQAVTLLSQYTSDFSRQLLVIFGLWIAAAFWRITGQQLAKLLCYQVSERVALDAQLKTMNHLFLLDIAWHERENAGNKIKRVQRGADGLDKIIRMWIDNFIEIGVNFVGMVTIIAIIDATVAGIMLLFMITLFSISFVLTRRSALVSNIVNIKEEELSGLTFEAINNIRSVKALTMADALLDIFERKIADLYAKVKDRIFSYRSREWAVGIWANAFRLGTIIFIAYGIIHGRYEVGFIVLFTGYFNKIWESVGELSSTAQDFIIAKYGIARMQSILNEPVTIDTEKGKLSFPEGWKKITLQNVSFSYGKRSALKNISFTLNRGEKVGIVGLSGAGKSTLLKLLLKESETYSGDIRFDDLALKKIDKKSYLARVAVVLQDTEVFNFSLRDNITIADFRNAADEARLQTALQVAHIFDLLGKLPNGLDTFIGEKGVKLSGGEKQRLGIARAIFKRPQILLLDEATSHLDLESEEKIRDSLHQFFKTVTAIVIAHRLTTIREMDRILVIENGEILEGGTFAELYEKQGRFFELWEKQKL